MEKREERLRDWDLQVSGTYYHECGAKMISLVKTSSDGRMILGEVPVICPDCDNIQTALTILFSHILTILGATSDDYKTAMYLIEKAINFPKRK
jgi:hypothetical protein